MTSRKIATALKTLLGLPLLGVLWLLLVRIVRHFIQFPMPEFAADLIDNPFRRKIQPPNQMPTRHNIQPGSRVLEIGPGNGTYSVATAQYLGSGGHLTVLDIEPRMIERTRRAARRAQLDNLSGEVGDVHHLGFADQTFDAAYMIAVTGEIPHPKDAMRELYRVLKPGGTLACSELFVDPDYPTVQTLTRWATAAGFQVQDHLHQILSYTIVFEKVSIYLE